MESQEKESATTPAVVNVDTSAVSVQTSDPTFLPLPPIGTHREDMTAKVKSIADVPTEVLQDILSYIPPLELVHVTPFVCRLWKSTSAHPGIWQSLCLARGWDGSDREALKTPDWRRYFWLRLAPVSANCTHFIPPEAKPLVDAKLPMSLSTFFFHYMQDDRREEGWNSFHRELGYTGPPEIDGWCVSPEGCCIYRSVRFVVHLTNPLGPKSTRVDQVHRLRFVSPGHMMFSTSSVSLDAPYSDAFTTESLWDIYKDAKNPSMMRLVIAAFTHFKRSVFLKAAIARGAQGGIDSYFPLWPKRIEKEAARLQALKKGQQQRRALQQSQTALSRSSKSLHVVSEVSDSIDSAKRPESDEKTEVQPKPEPEEPEKTETPEGQQIKLDEPAPNQSMSEAVQGYVLSWISTIIVWIMDLYAGKNRKQFFVGLAMILLLVSPTFYTLNRISNLKDTIAQTNDRAEAMEATLASLFYIVGQMNLNITGVGGSDASYPNLVEQWEHWKSTGQLEELYKEGFSRASAMNDMLEQAGKQASLLKDFLNGMPQLPRRMKDNVKAKNTNQHTQKERNRQEL